MKNMLKVVFVIIGTIIGAGFASGKEIYLFFGIYGKNGIYGIILSQILIGYIIYKVLILSQKEQIENYNGLANRICKNRQTNEILKIIITIFLLISFYVMIAGFSAYFSQELGIPSIIGSLIITTICYFVFLGNIERIMQVNSILIPGLILFMILLITKNTDAYAHINAKMIQPQPLKSILSAILYSSYNSITLIPMMISLKKYIKNKKQILQTSILCTIILMILAIIIYGLILKIDIDITKVELPTIYVAGMLGKSYQFLYGLTILVAILTSAISTGYSLLENKKAQTKQYKRLAIFLCVSALFVSKIGFSNLINTLYPIFGLLGILQISFLLRKK